MTAFTVIAIMNTANVVYEVHVCGVVDYVTCDYQHALEWCGRLFDIVSSGIQIVTFIDGKPVTIKDVRSKS